MSEIEQQLVNQKVDGISQENKSQSQNRRKTVKDDDCNGLTYAFKKLEEGGVEVIYSSGDESSDTDDDLPWRLLRPLCPSALFISKPDTIATVEEPKETVSIPEDDSVIASDPWDDLDRKSEVCLNVCKSLEFEINSDTNNKEDDDDNDSETFKLAVDNFCEVEVVKYLQQTETVSVSRIRVQKLKTATRNLKVKFNTISKRKPKTVRKLHKLNIIENGTSQEFNLFNSRRENLHHPISSSLFCKLVQKITYQFVPSNSPQPRFRATALLALLQATKAVLDGIIEDKYMQMLQTSPFE